MVVGENNVEKWGILTFTQSDMTLHPWPPLIEFQVIKPLKEEMKTMTSGARGKYSKDCELILYCPPYIVIEMLRRKGVKGDHKIGSSWNPFRRRRCSWSRPFVSSGARGSCGCEMRGVCAYFKEFVGVDTNWKLK